MSRPAVAYIHRQQGACTMAENWTSLKHCHSAVQRGAAAGDVLPWLPAVLQHVTSTKPAQDASSCSSDHLLALTILRLLYEKQDIYADLCIKLTETDHFHESLVTLLDDTDPLVSYVACRILIQVVKSSATFLGNLLTSPLRHCHGLIHTLDFFSSILSRKFPGPNTAVALQCIAYLSRHWEYLLNRCTDETETACFAFLSLWLKLVKFHHRGDGCGSVDDDQEFYMDTTILVDKLLGLEVPASCHCRAVDVLNAVMPHVDVSESAAPGTDGKTRGTLKWQPLATRILRSGLLETLATMVTCKVGFAGRTDDSDHQKHGHPDKSALRKLVLLTLKACGITFGSLVHAHAEHAQDQSVQSALSQLHFLRTMATTAGSSDHWLISTFSDQDDKLVEVMLSALDICVILKEKIPAAERNLDESSIQALDLDPHVVFCEFLHSTTWDHSILLDFLTSPETGFLVYVVRYLKYLARDWGNFVSICQARSNSRSSVGQGHQTEEQTHSSAQPCLVSYLDSSDSEDNNCETDPCNMCKEPGKLLSSSVKQTGDRTKSHVSKSPELGSESPSKSREPMGSEDGCSDLLCKASCSNNATPSIGETDEDPDDVNTTCTSEDVSCTDTDLDLSGWNCRDAPVCEVLEDTMSVLIRLRMAIGRMLSKGLFPYNAEPLLKLLEQVETCYEGDTAI